MEDLFETGMVAAEPEAEVVEAEVVETMPPPLPAISTHDARVALIRFSEQVERWKKRAAEITIITDDKTNATAAQIALEVKKVYKIIHDLHEHYKKPFLNAAAEVRTFATALEDPLEIIIKRLGRLQADYQHMVENEARKKKAAQKKEARELQERLNAEAKAAEEKGEVYTPVDLPAPVIEKPATVVRTEAGSSSQKRVWKHTVENEALVPREYLSVDDQKVKEAIKGGVREILGIKIFQEYQTRYRL